MYTVSCPASSLCHSPFRQSGYSCRGVRPLAFVLLSRVDPRQKKLGRLFVPSAAPPPPPNPNPDAISLAFLPSSSRPVVLLALARTHQRMHALAHHSPLPTSTRKHIRTLLPLVLSRPLPVLD
jgi:hypothetical protein